MNFLRTRSQREENYSNAFNDRTAEKEQLATLKAANDKLKKSYEHDSCFANTNFTPSFNKSLIDMPDACETMVNAW